MNRKITQIRITISADVITYTRDMFKEILGSGCDGYTVYLEDHSIYYSPTCQFEITFTEED